MSDFTYHIRITSNWANGRPSTASVNTDPNFLEFARQKRIYLPDRMSQSAWPDLNTVIRYFANEETAQEYITALTNLCTFLNRNDWSYTLEHGSITAISTDTWHMDSVWSTWIPAA